MANKSINGLVTLQYYTNRLHEAAAVHQIRTVLIHSFMNIDVSCLLGVSIVPLFLVSPPFLTASFASKGTREYFRR